MSLSYPSIPCRHAYGSGILLLCQPTQWKDMSVEGAGETLNQKGNQVLELSLAPTRWLAGHLVMLTSRAFHHTTPGDMIFYPCTQRCTPQELHHPGDQSSTMRTRSDLDLCSGKSKGLPELPLFCHHCIL